MVHTHRQIQLPGGYTNANTDPDGYGCSYSNTYSDADANPCSDADFNTNADSDTNPYTDAERYTKA
jgi:hypothetical protein